MKVWLKVPRRSVQSGAGWPELLLAWQGQATENEMISKLDWLGAGGCDPGYLLLVKVICNVKLSVADQQLKSVQSVVGLTTGNSGGKINCRSIGVVTCCQRVDA